MGPSQDLGWRLGTPFGIAWGPGLMLAAGLLVATAARGKRLALAGLVLLAVFDLGLYGMSYVWIDRPMTVDALARSVAPFAGSEKAERVESYRLLAGSPVVTLADVRLLGGYAALTPGRRLLQPQVHALPLELQYLFARKEMDEESWLAALRVGSVGWAAEAIEDPLPRARLVTRAEATTEPGTRIGSIEVATTALVESPLSLGGGLAGHAAITLDRPGAIHLTTQAPSRQLLVLSESHHAGWKVQIDGRKGEILRAYGDFMGVVVDPGRSELRFTFDPESLRVGKQLSLLGLVLTGAWMIVGLLVGRSVLPGDGAPV
jgi:hypothetical protein